jgi:hypothetical protein
MKYTIILSIVGFAFLTYNCKDTTAKRLNPADELLEKGIVGNGGWSNWKNLDTISFYKTTKLYLEDGSIEDSTFQKHTYHMYPEMNGKYSWEKDGVENVIEYKDGIITKHINSIKQELSQTEHEKLKKGFLGAQFVMCLPFKLGDPGVKLALDGSSQINGKEVDVLKASYHTQNENHTENHDWWHYINANTGALEGYKVHHPPTYARVSNVKTTTIKGIIFPTYRQTYRVDENDNRQYLRGEFWYEYL